MGKLAIDGGVPVRREPFPVRKPFGNEEIEEVTSAIESQMLFSPTGTKAKQFEKAFAERYGVKYAVMCSSGTAAIHLSVAALDPEPGSEIIVAPVTDLGSVVGIVFQGCVPVFADWKPGTMNMDPEDIEKRITERTKAVIVVHLAGNPCDMDAITDICSRHNLPVIEDSAQAYLAEFKGKLVGTIGAMGCFSMQQSKHLTTGEGGVTITNDGELAERLSLFRDKGWERWHSGARAYSMLGTNYRPNELGAGVALAQLSKLSDVVRRRRELASLLTSLIKDVSGIELPVPVEGTKNSYWFYPFFISGYDPQRFTKALEAEGIPVSLGYTGKPLYLLSEMFTKKKTFGSSGYPFNSPYYKGEVQYREGLCPVAEKELNRLAIVKIFENWRQEDIQDIAEAIQKVAEGL